ncbi:hypothetical protein [Bacillus sp. AK031]
MNTFNLRVFLVIAMTAGFIHSAIRILNFPLELEFNIHVFIACIGTIITIIFTTKCKHILFFIFAIFPLYLFFVIFWVSASTGDDYHFTAGMYLLPIVGSALLISRAWSQEPYKP